MAASIIRRPRRNQVAVDLARDGRRPLGGVEYSHGLCWLFRGSLEDVNRNGGTVTNQAWIQTPYGQALSPIANTNNFTGSVSSTYTLYGWVLHFFLSTSQLDSADTAFQIANFGPGYISAGSSTGNISGETITLLFGGARKGITETLAVNKEYKLAAVWNGSAYDIWLDGRIPTTVANPDATTLLTTCSQYVSVLRRFSTTPRFNALSTQIITRPIPTGFGRILSLDPYVLVRPAYDGSLRYDSGGAPAPSDVFFDNRIDEISQGSRIQTAAKLGGVLVE